MSKLRIEHGASKVRWSVLKTPIEEQIAADIDLMCQWSENERKYVVNELLRFALAQASEFQEYRAARSSDREVAAVSVPKITSVSENVVRRPLVTGDRAQGAAS